MPKPPLLSTTSTSPTIVAIDDIRNLKRKKDCEESLDDLFDVKAQSRENTWNNEFFNEIRYITPKLPTTIVPKKSNFSGTNLGWISPRKKQKVECVSDLGSNSKDDDAVISFTATTIAPSNTDATSPATTTAIAPANTNATTPATTTTTTKKSITARIPKATEIGNSEANLTGRATTNIKTTSVPTTPNTSVRTAPTKTNTTNPTSRSDINTDSDDDFSNLEFRPKQVNRKSKSENQFPNFSVVIPEFITSHCHMVDTNLGNVSIFRSALLDCDQVLLGALWEGQNTNYRNNGINIRSRIVGFLFCCDSDDGIYFMPINQHDGDEENLKWQVLKDLMETPTCIKIGVNLQHVLIPLYGKIGGERLQPINLWDPTIAAWIHESDWEDYKWIDLVFSIFGKTVDKGLKSNLEFILEDIPLTFQIFKNLKRKLEEHKLVQAFQFEMQIVPILAKMEVVGVGFNPESLSRYRTLLQEKLSNLKRQAEEILGCTINLASPNQVASAIYDKLKLTPRKLGGTPRMGGDGDLSRDGGRLTSNGKRSTSVEVLKQLGHPFPTIVLQYRKIQKYLSSWILNDSFFKDAIDTTEIGLLFHASDGNRDDDGPTKRIHSHWIHTGTGTGRLSCREPNLQNLPRSPMFVDIVDHPVLGEGENGCEDGEFLSGLHHQKEMKSETTIKVTVRDAFQSRNGYVLVGADYSQMELRILAHMSQDRYLLQYFKNNTDIFREIASRALDKPLEEVTDDNRACIKQVVYGILYGMGPKTLSSKLKISILQAENFIFGFLRKFSSVNTFIKSTQVETRKTHEIRTMLGRRRVLDKNVSDGGGENFRADRQAINSIIQGTAADIVSSLNYHNHHHHPLAHDHHHPLAHNHRPYPLAHNHHHCPLAHKHHHYLLAHKHHHYPLAHNMSTSVMKI
eukprot:TRINITY_DN4492_c1_g1_i1.p1 TRINITY_DN4492_c1_g1~~TRINITY_DN4492_c1_g1_i1.p1  ORF type:complete len:911 (-),score=208.08 TRINITY_DN4492_c1_g1_i1:315-3047(-)